MKVLDYKLNAVMAKARAIYGKRLTGADYNNLISCNDLTEAVSYLKSRTSYADDLSSVNSAAVDSGYIEFLIKKRAYNQFSNLCHYEMKFGEELYKYFIVNEEINQILSCIRSIMLGNTDEYIIAIPQFYYKSLGIDMYKIARAKSMQELSDALTGTPYSDIVLSCLKDEECNYLDFENSFYNYFYEFEYKLVQKNCKGKSKKDAFDLLKMRADTGFIDSLYRLKKYFPKTADEAAKDIIPIHLTRFTPKQINLIINTESAEEMLEVLKGTAYKDYAKKIQKSDWAEKAIQELNYKKYKHLLRFSTDPNVVMFCFMFLMDNEVNNLIHIIEALRYSASQESMLSLLIGVGD